MTQQEIIEDIKGRLRIPENVRKITILMEKNRLITRGDYYTMEDIHVLKQANPQDFLTACQILYPNGLPAIYANAKDAETTTINTNSDGYNSKKANSEQAWNFFGGLVNTAGGVLSNIYGKSDNSAERVLEQKEQEAKRKQTMMYVIIVVIGVVALAGIIFAIVKSNKSSNIIMK